jgi:hypothetical protein
MGWIELALDLASLIQVLEILKQARVLENGSEGKP